MVPLSHAQVRQRRTGTPFTAPMNEQSRAGSRNDVAIASEIALFKQCPQLLQHTPPAPLHRVSRMLL